MKNSVLGMGLLRHLASQGLRIFSTEQAQAAALEIKMNPSYVSEALHHMKNGGWVTRLKRGIYAIAAYGPAPHEFAVAMALVTPSAISHWTAMHYHHITEQTPNKIFNTESIIDRLWDIDTIPTNNTLRSHIKSLRKKLEDVGLDKNFIETIYGIGYRLKPVNEKSQLKTEIKKSVERRKLESIITSQLTLALNSLGFKLSAVICVMISGINFDKIFLNGI